MFEDTESNVAQVLEILANLRKYRARCGILAERMGEYRQIRAKPPHLFQDTIGTLRIQRRHGSISLFGEALVPIRFVSVESRWDGVEGNPMRHGVTEAREVSVPGVETIKKGYKIH